MNEFARALGTDFAEDNTQGATLGDILGKVSGKCRQCGTRNYGSIDSACPICGGVNNPLIVDGEEIELKHIPQLIPQPPVPLPAAVKRFCSEIDNNFEKTAANAVTTAEQLEQAAMELRKFAHDLRDAGPDVAGHVERWVRYEREADAREKFLRILFVGKGG